MPETTTAVGPQRLALLGATGSTGRKVLQKLLQNPNLGETRINIYVRSRNKLENLFPSLSTDPRITIFEGSIKDERVIRDCLANVDTIICTLGENENIPGIYVLEDFARTTIAALSSLRSETDHWHQPRLIMLSSATVHPKFAAPRPAIFHWMVRYAFYKPYNDLIKAQDMLLAEPSLVSVTLIQPNALVEEQSTGCVISTETIFIACSYEDLAEGFIMVCTLPSYREEHNIAVSSARAENTMLYAPFIFGKVLRGLAFQFIPFYWRAEYFITGLLQSKQAKSKKA